MLLLRFAPTVVGLLAFGAMAWLYDHQPAAYFWVLHFDGTLPWVNPFIDSSYMYAMKACWEHGVDIYKSVPCDVDKISNTKMAYSPLWPRLFFLPDENAARVPVGVVTDLLWIVSLSLLPPGRNWREAGLLALAVPSTMVCFAMERNNIDVWMYLIAVAGLLLLLRGGVWRWGGYGVFLFAGLLKYYPLALLGLALRDRPARFWAVAAVSFAALAVFVAVFWRELVEALPNVPVGNPIANLFGIPNMPLVMGAVIRRALGLSYHAAALLALVARLALTVLIVRWGWALARQPGLREGCAALAAPERDWLLAGALVITGCYFMGQNNAYRGIYMMIVLAGLIALLRRLTEPGARAQVRFAMLTVLPLMWDGGLQYWMLMGLPARLSGGLVLSFWLFRELAWVNLARVLLAVLLVYALETPVGRRWVSR